VGAYTPESQVWYPDITDTAKLNTLLATMASSIEEGIGKRLKLQEVAVGLKASIGDNGWNIPYGGANAAVIPYAITTSRGDFNNGFTFAGGIATVQTAGMYLVTASCGPLGATNGAGIRVQIVKGSTFIAGNEVAMGPTVWVGSTCTTVLNLVPGDTVHAKANISTTGGAMPNSGDTTHVSITLVQALPL
jgi:hypothetical protein